MGVVQCLVGVKDGVDTETIPYINQLNTSYTAARGILYLLYATHLFVCSASPTNLYAQPLLSHDKYPQWRYTTAGVNTPKTIHHSILVRAAVSSARKSARLGAKTSSD